MALLDPCCRSGVPSRQAGILPQTPSLKSCQAHCPSVRDASLLMMGALHMGNIPCLVSCQELLKRSLRYAQPLVCVQMMGALYMGNKPLVHSDHK